MPSSKAPTQETTESEIAATEIRDQQWQEYLDNKPIQDAAMTAMTGFTFNEDGTKNIQQGGRLNADGSVNTNTSAAHMATESAATELSLGQYAQGHVDQAIDDNVELATGEAKDSSTKAFQDQSDYLTGLDNVAAMGQGMETELTLGQLDQARTAEQQAAARAQQTAQRRAANGAAAGQLAGLGLGAFAASRSSEPQYRPENYNPAFNED